MLSRSQPCGMSLTNHGAVHSHLNALKFGRSIMQVLPLFSVLLTQPLFTMVLAQGLITEICIAFQLNYTRKIIGFRALDF